MKKVVVGISGGVDSSIAAYLLKEQGFDVTGLFMINWHDTTGTLLGDCPWNDDLIFAELVARKLEIPFLTVDFSKEYREKVVEYMFAEYQVGRTPNPDVLCNREVKFDLFLKAADEMGADYIATGHYCRKETIQKDGIEIYRLMAGTDPAKEQSYFLCQLNQQQLSRSLFPIGHLHKTEIRRLARKLELPTAERKDSQGICFVGKVDLPVFLQQRLVSAKGNIIEIPRNTNKCITSIPLLGNDYMVSELEVFSKKHNFLPVDGQIIGEHNGAHFFTIGQRKGINIGGKSEPLFVLDIDTQDNLVYVGQGHSHPGLNRFGLFIPCKDIHWIRQDLEMKPGDYRNYQVRVRYRQPLQTAGLYMKKEGLFVLFEEPQRGITPGQFAAWYDSDEMIGSGVID
jgi:tRNA-specific 2-thiouridylase